MIEDVPPEFVGLSWTELNALSRYYNRLSNNLNRRAIKMKEFSDIEKASKQRIDDFADSYKTVISYMDNGKISLNEAITMTAIDLNTKDETIRGWWKWFVKSQQREEREIRNKAIIDMVKLGLKNTEIAERMAIHQNTVSRAITEALHSSLRPVDRARLRKRRKVTIKPN